MLRREKDYPKVVDPRLSEHISQEKNTLKLLQEKMHKLLSPQLQLPLQAKQNNKDLYLQFKIELNRLMTSDHFESKLKKLLSFLSVGNDIVPDPNQINQLEDDILKKVMLQVENIKVGRQQLG